MKSLVIWIALLCAGRLSRSTVGSTTTIGPGTLVLVVIGFAVA
jgi:hypothetical protein